MSSPARHKPGPKPVLLPQWDIAAKADDLLGLLGLTEKQINWEILPKARTIQEIKRAFGFDEFDEWSQEKKRLWQETKDGQLILDWIREGKAPRVELRAKMRHLAESIAAPSMISNRKKISLRRSRDLCWKRRQHGTILRVEPYIECSCRYKGPAKNQMCPRCGAKILPHFRRFFSSFSKP